MAFPRMLRVRQKFDAPRVEDIPAEVDAQLDRLQLGQVVQPGQTVAITAGSRGIANIAVITKAICDHVKKVGGVPASHSSDGQPRRRDGGRPTENPRRLRYHGRLLCERKSGQAWRP